MIRMTEDQYREGWQRQVWSAPKDEQAAPARASPETAASTPSPSQGKPTPRLDALTRRVDQLEAHMRELDASSPVSPTRSPAPIITGHMIVDMVSFGFCVPCVDMVSRRNVKSIVLARQVAAYLMRHLTSLSFPQIGRLLGGRDHTTIMHAIVKITTKRETDTLLNAKLKHMEDELRKAARRGSVT